jgi:hypothetical protein
VSDADAFMWVVCAVCGRVFCGGRGGGGGESLPVAYGFNHSIDLVQVASRVAVGDIGPNTGISSA